MRKISLAARLDQEAVRQSVTEMQQALQNGGAEIDGSAVEKIGLAGLSMLASAMRSASDVAPVTLSSPSPALCQAAHMAGLADSLSIGSEPTS